MTRSAIYCRISQDQSGEGLGVARQLEDCKHVAEQAGWTVAEVFSDNDISASSGKPRPEYRRMLRAIEANEIDAIVAWAPDRLYRKLADLEELIPLVEKHGTAIRTCRAGDFDLATPLGKMIARILGAVATGEGDVKTDRWRRSVRQRREAGVFHQTGPRLYGYTRTGEIIPAEADQIRATAAELLDGIPLTRATINLNARGSHTTQGNRWVRASVRKLLKNGRLAGRSVMNGDTLGTGQWEPILDDPTFEQLQAVLDARRGTGTPRPRIALLLGIAHCGRCGNRLVSGRRSRTGRGGREQVKIRLYRCSALPGEGGCGGLSVDAEAVEEIVEEYAKTRLQDPAVRTKLETLVATTSTSMAEILTLETRLVELEAELDAPGVPVGAILRAMDRTRERIGHLRATTVDTTATPLRGQWPTDLARRARLVRLVVDSVTVNPASNRTGGAFDPHRVQISDRV